MSVESLTRPDNTRRYKVRWKEAGRDHARSFNRLKDARAFDEQIKALKAAGGLDIFLAGEQTLQAFADTWWDRHAARKLRPRVQKTYALQLDKRILPALGGYQLRQLTPARIAEFDARMDHNGDGEPTRVKALTVLQAILKQAVIDGALRSNPVMAIDKPSQRRTREPVLISPTQVEAIRSLLKPRDAALVSLLAYAGLRPESEGVTLPWTRVRERSILVAKGYKRGSKERSVRLLEPLAEDLEEWRSSSRSRGLVFPSGSGGEWRDYDWKNWQRRVFKPAALKAGLPKDVRARDLRGSFATLLIFEGRNIAEVAAQLGHSPETCLRDYLSVIHEYEPSQRVDADVQIRKARGAVS